MRKFERSIVSLLARRFRSRAVVELENLALRHQLHVLRRQRPGRLRLFTFDRLLWVLLYRLWPRCLEAMVLVKAATVVQWLWLLKTLSTADPPFVGFRRKCIGPISE
jgi:hypothetical protein